MMSLSIKLGVILLEFFFLVNVSIFFDENLQFGVLLYVIVICYYVIFYIYVIMFKYQYIINLFDVMFFCFIVEMEIIDVFVWVYYLMFFCYFVGVWLYVIF